MPIMALKLSKLPLLEMVAAVSTTASFFSKTCSRMGGDIHGLGNERPVLSETLVGRDMPGPG